MTRMEAERIAYESNAGETQGWVYAAFNSYGKLPFVAKTDIWGVAKWKGDKMEEVAR